MKKFTFIFYGLIVLTISAKSQTETHIKVSEDTSRTISSVVVPKNSSLGLYKFRKNESVVPIIAIIAISPIQHTAWIKKINNSLNNQIHKIGFRNSIDDYLQYTPMLTSFVLEMGNTSGRHSLAGKTVLIASSAIINTIITHGMKNSFRTLRPDGSAYNSFPSGHTATAFMGAEFLRREYGHHSIWYTVMGYTVAVFTGYMRMQNNRHWLTDVVAGAGVGVLSAQIAYWSYPSLRKLIPLPKTYSKYSH